MMFATSAWYRAGSAKREQWRTMEPNVTIAVETKPALNTDDLEHVVATAGDEMFHESIVGTNCIGESGVEGGPGIIEMEVEGSDGAVEGMALEAELFLEVACERFRVDVRKIDAAAIPMRSVIEERFLD